MKITEEHVKVAELLDGKLPGTQMNQISMHRWVFVTGVNDETRTLTYGQEDYHLWSNSGFDPAGPLPTAGYLYPLIKEKLTVGTSIEIQPYTILLMKLNGSKIEVEFEYTFKDLDCGFAMLYLHLLGK
jgi:hypothetical protein